MLMTAPDDRIRSSTAKPAIFQFRVRQDNELTCWVSRPETPDPHAVPLVAVHGLQRGARLQASLLGEIAALSGRTVVAPLFDTKNWPKYQQVVRKGRADLALLRLMDDLRALGMIADGPFDLFGYSAGGQFAHRFAMLYPLQVRQLSVAAAGWYTLPDASDYPYGIGQGGQFGSWGKAMTSGLDAFLKLDIRVLVGAEDCTPDDNTRRAPEVDAQQGIHRLERARNWVSALHRAAEERGLGKVARLTVLPGCGHSFEDCVRIGGLGRLVVPDVPPPVASEWRN